ncbi:hypothetical protein RF11_06874 [Thelohanellus kitauei]|uniref:MD-2-related lipid-recognition domain-containing protein n=1 Tax=Thelohanellus kitauei TaxID=669202 RepID=A0A0C2IZK9_THEKT|nr:hypothetical protein RF11_06874 [Thelohanellus kitauei]
MFSTRSCCFVCIVIFTLEYIQCTHPQLQICQQNVGTSKASFDSLTGCTRDLCKLKMATTVTAKFTITPKVSSKKLHVKATAYGWIFSTPIPGIPSDGCIIKGFQCPWPANETRTVSLHAHVPYFVFQFTGSIRIEIKNERHQWIGCFTGTAYIVH